MKMNLLTLFFLATLLIFSCDDAVKAEKCKTFLDCDPTVCRSHIVICKDQQCVCNDPKTYSSDQQDTSRILPSG